MALQSTETPTGSVAAFYKLLYDSSLGWSRRR